MVNNLSQMHWNNKILTFRKCLPRVKNYSSSQLTEKTHTTRNINNIVKWNLSTIWFTTSLRISYQFSKISWSLTMSTSSSSGLIRMLSKSHAYHASFSSTSVTWWLRKCIRDAWTHGTTLTRTTPRCYQIQATTYLKILRGGSGCVTSEITSKGKTWRRMRMRTTRLRMPTIEMWVPKTRKKRKRKHRRDYLIRNSWKVCGCATKT